ncbi:MAG: hypothetical protein L3J26_04660 [Candidatus Polarisedimenticolaceae bacterium]|nr:hypothetical protein [Candidatus Polarisedimenticolaceae bacterium]
MVTKSIPALRLSPQKSATLLTFILATHASAMGMALFLPLEFWLQLLVLLAVAVSLIQATRTHLLRSNGSAIRSAQWDSAGEWMLFFANGDEIAAQLKASSYLQPWLVVLNFSTSRFRRHTLILLPDAVDPERLRRLRVRLRLLGSKDTA